MQAVPALDGEGLAAKRVVAGDAPHVGLHAVFFGEDGLRAHRFVADGAAAEQLHRGLAAGS